MAANIQDFYQRAQAGFSRDFSFRIKTISWGIEGIDAFSGDKELVYARSATFPGRSIQDKTVNFAGQEFHLGGKADYSGSSGWGIDFYCDEECSLRGLLEKVSRSIFGTEDGNINAPPIGTGAYGIGQGTINLEVIDKSLEPVSEIKLIGTQLRDLGDISYAIADGSGEVQTFDATFAYQWYQIPTIGEFGDA